MCRIDDGEVQAGLHCVEKEDRIEDLPRIRIDPERQVAHPEDGQHAGQAGLDQADCFHCLDGCVGKVGLASSDWKGERIKDEGFRGHAVLAAHNRMDFLGRLELPLGIGGLASLINAHCDGNRAVFLHQRHPLVDPFGPILRVDAVQDGPAWIDLEGGPHYIDLGGVDHQRCFK